MQSLMKIFATLAFGFGLPLSSQALSLDEALNRQTQILISPVAFQGAPVFGADPEAMLVCASLGYSRLVSFTKTTKSWKEFANEKYATIATSGLRAGGNSPGPGTFFEIQQAPGTCCLEYDLLTSVTCAR